MSISHTFGDPNRYYARPSHTSSKLPGSMFGDPIEGVIRDLLIQRHRDLRERVDATTKRQNSVIRELLAKHTAVRLSVGHARQPVSVSVVDGLPEPLADMLRTISEPEIWELILNRSLLQSTIVGLDFTHKRLDAIAAWQPFADIDVTELSPSLRRSHEFISQLAARLEQTHILEQLMSIDQDVLGAYFFRHKPPTIKIYWMAIGIFAALQDISVESLTIVTLAHELAHAFTHIGYDTDKQQWDTDTFADTDHAIVEGLAQFYTEIVCKEFDEKNFGAGSYDAFNSLLRQQPPQYTCFKQWVSNAKNRQEIIRSCLIQCRTDHTKDYRSFEVLLGTAAQRIDPKAKR